MDPIARIGWIYISPVIPQAVSYTHLDVYKIQEPNRLSQAVVHAASGSIQIGMSAERMYPQAGQPQHQGARRVRSRHPLQRGKDDRMVRQEQIHLRSEMCIRDSPQPIASTPRGCQGSRGPCRCRRIKGSVLAAAAQPVWILAAMIAVPMAVATAMPMLLLPSPAAISANTTLKPR